MKFTTCERQTPLFTSNDVDVDRRRFCVCVAHPFCEDVHRYIGGSATYPEPMPQSFRAGHGACDAGLRHQALHQPPCSRAVLRPEATVWRDRQAGQFGSQRLGDVHDAEDKRRRFSVRIARVHSSVSSCERVSAKASEIRQPVKASTRQSVRSAGPSASARSRTAARSVPEMYFLRPPASNACHCAICANAMPLSLATESTRGLRA